MRSFIRFLIILFLFLFAATNRLSAAEIRNSYEDYQKTIINKPACDPITGAAPEGSCFYQAPKRAHQAPYNVCSCVSYARWRSGINVPPMGLAKYWPVNSDIPVVGAVVVFGGSSTGHAAVVVEILGTKMRLDEANYTRCRVTTDRWVDMNDPTILGYSW